MGPDDLPEDIELVFKGIDGAEAESFIQAVQRSARTEGRSRDNEWIIDLVSTCMTGEALRWYVELDEETQNDWKLLRKAILRQYPPLSKPSTSALAPIIPTPAAAAIPPTPTSATHSNTSVTQSTQAPARIYRIRVYFTDTPSRFFLSTKDEKHICLTNNVSRAFTVRWTSKKEERKLNA
ncbi:hypothetical protein FRC04_010338 [Tulasnella sp. 424]|nr:hypothetical protein FRC04_010338 [Tulasnella sp. 424]